MEKDFQDKKFNAKFFLLAGKTAGIMLFFRPIIYFIFSRRRELNEAADVDLSAGIFALYSIAIFLVGYITLLRTSKNSIGKKLIKNGPIYSFLLYSFICLLSTIWSVNPAMTFYRSFECISFVLLIIAIIQNILSKYSFDILIQWFIGYIFIEVFISVLAAIRNNEGLTGIIVSAQMSATIFIFLVIFCCKNKIIKYALIAIAIISHSTTSYIGMLFGTTYLSFYYPKWRQLFIVLVLLVLPGVLFINPTAILKSTIFINHPEIVDSWDFSSYSSGRDNIFETVLEEVSDNALGYGFVAGENHILYARNFRAISCHNSFLSSLVGCGYLGLLFFTVFLISCFKSLLKIKQPIKIKSAIVASFLIVLVHILANPTIGTRISGSWISSFIVVSLISASTLYIKNNENIIFESCLS